MELLGRPNITINRFGNIYKSDDKGIIEYSNDEEKTIFKAYGFMEQTTVEGYIDNQQKQGKSQKKK